MTRCRNIRRTLSLAAAAALGTLTLNAAAQVRVDTGGANDASNRVGSFGRNDVGYLDPSYLSGRSVYGRGDALDVRAVRGNQVVTGNVTNFKYFRGSVPYSDAREFRGRQGSASFDRFFADSAGVPLPNQGPTMATETRPFYGAALVAPPPPGFSEVGFTGNYTPAPAPPPPTGVNSQLNTGYIENRLLEGRSTSDLLVMPGPVDPVTQLPSVLTASPLLGVRQWDLNSASDKAFLSNYGGTSLSSGQITLAPNEILQMKIDVARAAGRLPAGLAGTGEGQPLETGNLARPVPQPFESPQNQNLAATPQANPLMQQPLDGHVRQEGSMASQLAVPPALQSSQYNELQKRLDRYYTKRLESDEDRNRELIRQLKAREAQQQPTPQTPAPLTPPTTPPQADPDYNRISQNLLQQKTPRGMVPEPVQISSLATGVKAEQLKGILGKAEGLMQEGKYVSALEQYGKAGQVVPNNPLVMVGQAHAELAAGYYKQAEQHLRRAFETDPVLTMAQFDLKQMIGRERLAVLITDLKEAARRQDKDAGPAFLLAYLAYNTGSAEQAGIYLDLAQKRAGENDKLFRLLKMNWAIPASTPATQPANK